MEERLINLFRNKFFVRTIHGVLVIIFSFCIAILYFYAINDKEGNILYAVCIILFLEGAALIANKGRCPLEYTHKRANDKKGFFDLFIPSWLASYVIPVAIILTAVGFLLLYL